LAFPVLSIPLLNALMWHPVAVRNGDSSYADVLDINKKTLLI